MKETHAHKEITYKMDVGLHQSSSKELHAGVVKMLLLDARGTLHNYVSLRQLIGIVDTQLLTNLLRTGVIR